MKLCFSSVLSPLVMALCMAGDLAAIEKPEPLYKTIQCTKEELMTFFPEVVVKAVLEKAKIPNDKAEGIAEEMSHKDDELMKMVESKASKLDPNPLRDLGQRDVAIKIYRESLLQEFSKVLQNYGITDEIKVQALLDEIQRTKSKLFVECIRRQYPEQDKGT